MLNKEAVLETAKQNKQIKTAEISSTFGVSRQYANLLINELVSEKKLIKFGSTAKSFYVLPDYLKEHPELFPRIFKRILVNKNLEEHTIFEEIEGSFSDIFESKENLKNIFTYSFSEIMNNAIEHSGSSKIEVNVLVEDGKLLFTVNDFGIGAFRNVMKKLSLGSETEAIQKILKGKTTTMPRSHSGEGIFFTSKIAKSFVIQSFEYELNIDNEHNEILIKRLNRRKRGTKVSFSIDIKTDNHLSEIFKKFSIFNDENGVSGFDKTEINIKLYENGGVFISRSQARRILDGLDKFKSIIFDFDKVPMVGQAFADEMFRVFRNKYPDIKLQAVNTCEPVKFMIGRVEGFSNELIK